ncbi:MAG: hypothetical protein NT069_08265, partial [Planctomycetota bacterium]|nr:hypothetical protein [Planctomycetota bacterium]
GVVYHAIPETNDSPDIKEHILDTFDWFSPTYQSKHTYPEVFSWFEEAGLEQMRCMPHPVGVSGKKTCRRLTSGHASQGLAIQTGKSIPRSLAVRVNSLECVSVRWPRVGRSLRSDGTGRGILTSRFRMRHGPSSTAALFRLAGIPGLLGNAVRNCVSGGQEKLGTRIQVGSS